MNYSCGVIQDLLPLYIDHVCSEESRIIVEIHLKECECCREIYRGMQEAEYGCCRETDNKKREEASFQNVRKKLIRRQLTIVIVSFLLLAGAMLAAAGILKKTTGMIVYDHNISVQVAEQGIVGKLQGNQANRFRVKRVDVMEDGKKKSLLFFCLYGTAWDELVTGENVFSEYILCPADKKAEEIDAVFYYTGNTDGIEEMNQSELQNIKNNSILLWSK